MGVLNLFLLDNAEKKENKYKIGQKGHTLIDCKMKHKYKKKEEAT